MVTVRHRHPLRASGMSSVFLLFVQLGCFAGALYAFAAGYGWAERAGFALAWLLTAGLWFRETLVTARASNKPAQSRPELMTARLLPLMVFLALLYVVSVLASDHFGAGAQGFTRGMLLSLPFGLAAGWAVLFCYLILESDEMVRSGLVQAAASAGFAVIAGVTAWTLIGVRAGAPPLPGEWLLPAFAVLFGAASALISRRFS
jgi:uncharacterized membrane protein YciS (DUF1049 family)